MIQEHILVRRFREHILVKHSEPRTGWTCSGEGLQIASLIERALIASSAFLQAVELGANTFCFRHVEVAPPAPWSSPHCFLGLVPEEPLLPLSAPSLLPPTVSLSAPAGADVAFGCGLYGSCNASVSLSAVPASVEESAVLKHLSLRKGQREMPCFLCQNQGQEGDTVLSRMQFLVCRRLMNRRCCL